MSYEQLSEGGFPGVLHPLLMAPVLRSCQSSIRIRLLNHLHLQLQLGQLSQHVLTKRPCLPPQRVVRESNVPIARTSLRFRVHQRSLLRGGGICCTYARLHINLRDARIHMMDRLHRWKCTCLRVYGALLVAMLVVCCVWACVRIAMAGWLHGVVCG